MKSIGIPMMYKGIDGRMTLDDFDILPTNRSKKWFTGKIVKSNNFGEAYIVGKLNKRYEKPSGQSEFPYFIVQFNDQTLVVVKASCLFSGEFKNPYRPAVYGVGFKGQGTYSWKSSRKLYELWHDMLGRCYDISYHEKHPTYKDCTVAPRWHNFQNFCEDIQELKGYAEWKADTNKRNKYELDKDQKQQGVKSKIYSKDTCKFVTQEENVCQATITGKTYIAHRIADGYEEEFGNQHAFARKYMLDPSNIGCVLRKAYGHTNVKGWTFKVKENQNDI